MMPRSAQQPRCYPPATDTSAVLARLMALPPAERTALLKFSADQPRDADGRWTSSGDQAASTVSRVFDDAKSRAWDTAKSVAKSITVGVALTAAASIMAAAAPEAFALAGAAAAGEAAAAAGASASEAVAAATVQGRFAAVTKQVQHAATGAFWTAGLKAGSAALNALGVDTSAVTRHLEPLQRAYDAVMKATDACGLDPRLVSVLADAADHARDVLVAHLSQTKGDMHGAVVAGIGAALADYRADLGRLSTEATG